MNSTNSCFLNIFVSELQARTKVHDEVYNKVKPLLITALQETSKINKQHLPQYIVAEEQKLNKKVNDQEKYSLNKRYFKTDDELIFELIEDIKERLEKDIKINN